MYDRIIHIEDELDMSLFLFGARKTEDNIEIIFVRDFFRMLWNGELF